VVRVGSPMSYVGASSDARRTACWTGIRTVPISDSAIMFQDELVRAYRAFLTKRRALRPESEYRQPTDEEWREFQRHFELRKVELGTCGRPYGHSRQHEHACIRCPMLRIDPRARGRLTEITKNLTARTEEARAYGWLGEVEGLQVSLTAAKDKLVQLERAERAITSSTTDLGIPVVRSDP